MWSLEIEHLLHEYKKEITLILATAIATFLFTKVLPTVFSGIKQALAYLFALCSGRGREYAFVRQYLQWLVNEHRYSTIVPSQVLDPEKVPRLPQLEDVYIRLQLRSSNDERVDLAVRDLLDDGARTVLLGDPGAGKTTYLKYVALVLARRGLSSFMNLRRRRKLSKQLGSAAQRIPVFIHLNRLYRDSSELSSTLQGVALGSLPEFLRRKCPANFFDKLLENGDVLMLLDGLDEIASAELRMRAMNEIGTLANAAHSNNAWIVTSRIVGYKPRLQESAFQLAMVQQLVQEQVRQFVLSWYANKCQMTGYRAEELEYQRHRHLERAEHLVNTLASNAGLRSLTTSPMLVSLITMLHSVRLELPENRALLYRDCVELLAGRWDLYRGVASDQTALSITSAQKLAFLTALAWKMHSEKRREIGEDEVEAMLTEHLARVVSSAGSAVPIVFIEALLERSGIIISRGVSPSGGRLLAFSHLSFQEYLTSCWFQDLPADETHALLLERYSDPWWREAILLYVAQMEFPLRITMRFYERARSEGNLDAMLFAGYCLAEVQAEKNEPVFRDVLNDAMYIVSGSRIGAARADLLAGDRHNLLLRYLLSSLEEILRVRTTAARLIYSARLGQPVQREALQACLEELRPRGEVASFDRQLITCSPRFGVPVEAVFRIAVQFPGAAEELLKGRHEQEIDTSVLTACGWTDLVKVRDAGVLISLQGDRWCRARTWKERLVLGWLARSEPRPPLEEGKGDAESAGESLLESLRKPSTSEAAFRIHKALCGRGMALPADQLGMIYDRTNDPRVRSMAVMGALLNCNSGSESYDLLIKYVSRSLDSTYRHDKSSSLERARERAWQTCLTGRCLAVMQHSEAPNHAKGFIDFVLRCFASQSIDARAFATRKLWALAPLSPEAVTYCTQKAESENNAERWGAVLALAHARDHYDDKVLRCLLSQFYDHEYQFQGWSLRDVAAYSLMSLTTA